MRNLLVQPQARLDLLEIWHYIAENNQPAANRVLEAIEAAIGGLLEMPGKGHHRSDVPKNTYRFWTVYSYVIAFRYDERTLTIVRVLHGRRDFRRLFPK